MMTPRQSFEEIASLLERGMAEPDPRDARATVIAAHTHAVIQAATLRKQEAWAERVAAEVRGEALH